MRLYLSSYHLGNSPERFTQLIGKNKKTAIIMNASDVYGASKRPLYLKQFIESLNEIGLHGEDLDLRNYFGRTETLASDLKDFGSMWVSGGNTFVLRKAMHESGLDKILAQLLTQTEFVYGGFSAGACVLSPSLKGIHLVDEPEKTPEGYPSEAIWDGLGIVDFYIAPHFRSPHPESEAIENVVNYFKAHDLPYHALVDGEAIVINECVIRSSRPGIPV